MSDFNAPYGSFFSDSSIGAITGYPSDRVSGSFPQFTSGCIIDPRTKCIIGTSISGLYSFNLSRPMEMYRGPILD